MGTFAHREMSKSWRGRKLSVCLPSPVCGRPHFVPSTPPRSCVNQKCLRTLASIPWRIKLPLVENCWSPAEVSSPLSFLRIPASLWETLIKGWALLKSSLLLGGELFILTLEAFLSHMGVRGIRASVSKALGNLRRRNNLI